MAVHAAGGSGRVNVSSTRWMRNLVLVCLVFVGIFGIVMFTRTRQEAVASTRALEAAVEANRLLIMQKEGLEDRCREAIDALAVSNAHTASLEQEVVDLTAVRDSYKSQAEQLYATLEGAKEEFDDLAKQRDLYARSLKAKEAAFNAIEIEFRSAADVVEKLQEQNGLLTEGLRHSEERAALLEQTRASEALAQLKENSNVILRLQETNEQLSEALGLGRGKAQRGADEAVVEGMRAQDLHKLYEDAYPTAGITSTLDGWWKYPDSRTDMPPDFSGDVFVSRWTTDVDFPARRSESDDDDDGILNIALSLLVWKSDFPLNVCLESLLRSDLMKHRVFLFVWTNQQESDAVTYIDKLLQRPDARFADVIRVQHVEGRNLRIALPRIFIMEAARTYDVPGGIPWLLEMHDDMVLPSFFFERLIRHDGPHVGILQGYLSMSPISEDVVSELESIDAKNARYVNESGVHLSQPIHPWLIKMRMVEDIGYYQLDMILGAEDTDLWYRVFRSPQWDLVSVRGVYTVHQGTTSRSNDKDVEAREYFDLKYSYDDGGRNFLRMQCSSIVPHRKEDGDWFQAHANVEVRPYLAHTGACADVGALVVQDYSEMEIPRDGGNPIIFLKNRIFPTKEVIDAAFAV